MPSNAFEKSVRRTSFMDCYQCITVRQRPTRSPFAHYSALFLCTLSIFHDVTLPCYTFFMLHPFSIALNFCCTFFMLNFFHIALFHGLFIPCCTFLYFFMLSSFDAIRQKVANLFLS